MVTLENIVEILSRNQSALSALLVHLDLLGELVVHDRTNPTLQNSDYTTNIPIVEFTDCEEWINEWRDLFEDILSSSGLSMGKGNKQACIERMKLFLSKVGNNVDLIFTATTAYLQDCIDKGRKAKMPEYFILPQGEGKLSTRDIRTGGLYEWYTEQLNGSTQKTSNILDA